MSIQAVIFDLDGVLVDSEPAHRVASRRLVAPATMTDEQYARFVGASVEAFMAWIHDEYMPATPVAIIGAQYDRLVEQEVIAQRLPPFDGAVDLLTALEQRGIGLAVASQSLRRWVHATLDGAGLRQWFQQVVTAEDTPRPKPAPDIYLATAALLHADPQTCLVVEDSVYGVQSGIAAGMPVVQSRQGTTAPRPQPGAAHVIASLREFDLAWLA